MLYDTPDKWINSHQSFYLPISICISIGTDKYLKTSKQKWYWCIPNHSNDSLSPVSHNFSTTWPLVLQEKISRVTKKKKALQAVTSPSETQSHRVSRWGTWTGTDGTALPSGVSVRFLTRPPAPAGGRSDHVSTAKTSSFSTNARLRSKSRTSFQSPRQQAERLTYPQLQ